VPCNLLALLTCLSLLLTAWPSQAQVRIKDISDLEGVRDNQLVGYGLVVGLNGTGDNAWVSTRVTRSPRSRPRTSPR
jgi:flagellar basal body P-ring protein FlgI